MRNDYQWFDLRMKYISKSIDDIKMWNNEIILNR